MSVIELQPKDLSFVLVELELVFGSFSGSQFSWVVAAGSSDRGADTRLGLIGWVDIVGMDVSVETLEKEDWDLEEREG